MGYDVNKETVSVNNVAFEGCRELPVDLDLNLPDYCPDIQKILKCGVEVKITSRNISGDRLNIEGLVNCRLIYVGAEKKSVRLCENASPFSCSIDLKVSPENAVAVTSSKIEYMNCRAVNPRKVDVHGAIAICAKVYNKDSMEISSSVVGDDIEQKKSLASVSNLECVDQQQFSISEILDLGQNKPMPEMIVRSDVSLTLEDFKCMDGKIMVKGEALIKILYISDSSSNSMEVMEFSVPFSQVVDIPGAAENSKCEVILEILGHEEQIQTENAGDSNLISEDIRACATVFAYGEQEIEVVQDAYSTKYDVECESEIIKLCKLADHISTCCCVKASIEFTEFNISRVTDIWIDNSSINSRYENGSIVYDGKMSVCILAVDLEDTPFYIERIVEVSCTKGTDKELENVSINSLVSPASIGYRITGSGSIEIKADLKMHSWIYCCQKIQMLESVDTQTPDPKAKEKDSVLTIYYAKPGESLWDIAKRYYTSSDRIKDENDIKQDTIEYEMSILIPM